MNIESIGGYKIRDQFATHFLTFTIVGWVDVFSRRTNKEIIIESLNYCKAHKGLVIYAFVIMSNHMHVIARASQNSKGLSAIIRDFKRHTSRKLIDSILNNRKESRKDWMLKVFSYHAKFNSNNVLYQIWQQHNQPQILLRPRFIMQKLNYIHNNPVKAKIVLKPEHYLFSSAVNYAGLDEIVLEVEIIDLGMQEGYVFVG